jgi:hypothetical protein
MSCCSFADNRLHLITRLMTLLSHKAICSWRKYNMIILIFVYCWCICWHSGYSVKLCQATLYFVDITALHDNDCYIITGQPDIYLYQGTTFHHECLLSYTACKVVSRLCSFKVLFQESLKLKLKYAFINVEQFGTCLFVEVTVYPVGLLLRACQNIAVK